MAKQKKARARISRPKTKPNKAKTIATRAKPGKVWLVAVDMGYGHQRPAHALKHLAHSPVITANNYLGIPVKDRNVWLNSQKFYEYVSRIKHIPFIGGWIFDTYDKFQSIGQYYPYRDLSKPNFAVKQTYRLFKKGWGKHLIDKLSKQPTPLITTFFTVAFMAEYHNYPGPIYCVTTDSDISRAWAPLEPHKTRIIYLASTDRAYSRLKEYGIPEKNILLCGFPLPQENIGDERLLHLKERILNRLSNLDPNHSYLKRHYQDMARYLGAAFYPKKADHPITITFAVGGAGAQKEIGIELAKSLAPQLCKQELRINLVAATHKFVRDYFQEELRKQGLDHLYGSCINIIYEPTKDKYFETFNQIIDQTDVLWTKPSELCFFAGLGIPIILSPTIGAQEDSNSRWVKNMGAGFEQGDPQYANEWLLDWIQKGFLAEAAMKGFIEAPYLGTLNVERALAGKSMLKLYDY